MLVAGLSTPFAACAELLLDTPSLRLLQHDVHLNVLCIWLLCQNFSSSRCRAACKP